MHKKGISLVAGSAVGALVLGIMCSGVVFADDEPNCATDSNTGLEVCTYSNGAKTYGRSGSATATVNVAVGSCSFERSAGSGTYMGTLANGAAPISVTGSTFKTLCNDGGGYAVYAVGYSNDELGNTDLISNLGASDNIHTGVYVDSSSPSSWAMKLENNSSDYAPAVINNATGSDFTTFHAIPNNYTMVASYNGSTLDPSSGSNTGSTIKTTYQAYASYIQPAGTYTGQVKYTMVHPNDDAMTTDEDIDDIVYLQDFASLSSIERASVIDSMVEEQAYTRKDSRDNQDYTIAKLKDGKVWMIKNLNIAGGTTLTSSNTDFTDTYFNNYVEGNSRLAKASGGLMLPASDTSGFNNNDYSFVYNSSNETCSGSPCYSYYSWDAATLGSGRATSTDNTDAEHSICPKGWELPSSRTTSVDGWQIVSDFYMLAHQYGLDSTTSASESDSGFYDDAGPGTAPNFLLAGYYDNGSFNNGSDYGLYWSATSGGGSARNLYFTSSYVNSASDSNRRFGYAVRCIVAE
ncbi:hypothetical protein IJJ53_00710 [Candidatus Saccharibacteria bacterium]|nr:hypothetical protein [Candidatus Saccharibacteria bacterium]